MELGTPMYVNAIARVQQELVERFGDGFSPAEVEAVVARGLAQLEESGRHAGFIPALLDHWARDELPWPAPRAAPCRRCPSCSSSASGARVAPRSPPPWPNTCRTVACWPARPASAPRAG